MCGILFTICTLRPVQNVYVASCAEVVCYILRRSCMLQPVQKYVTACAEVVCYILCRSCMLHPVQKLCVTSCAEVVCYSLCRSCMLHPVQKLDVTSCAEVVCCILCRSCNLHPVQDLSVTSMRLSRTTELSVAVIGHLVFCSRQQRVLSQDQALRQVVVNFSNLDSGLLLLPFWAQYVIGCILLSSSMHINDL